MSFSVNGFRTPRRLAGSAAGVRHQGYGPPRQWRLPRTARAQPGHDQLHAGFNLRDLQIAAQHADREPRCATTAPQELRPPPELHPRRIHGLRHVKAVVESSSGPPWPSTAPRVRTYGGSHRPRSSKGTGLPRASRPRERGHRRPLGHGPAFRASPSADRGCLARPADLTNEVVEGEAEHPSDRRDGEQRGRRHRSTFDLADRLLGDASGASDLPDRTWAASSA